PGPGRLRRGGRRPAPRPVPRAGDAQGRLLDSHDGAPDAKHPGLRLGSRRRPAGPGARAARRPRGYAADRRPGDGVGRRPAGHPAGSCGGSRVAFRRFTDHGSQLWVYDLSGGASTLRQEATLDMQGAAWLNDNSTLVAAAGAGAQATLYRINVFAPGEAGGVLKLTGSAQAPNGSAPSTP